jgi:predicted transcriptional regulator
MMVGRETRTINWAVDVASRLKGAQFPMYEDEARNRLRGLTIKGLDVGSILEGVDFPVDTPAILLHRLSERLDKSMQ